MKNIKSNSNNPYPVYYCHIERLAELKTLDYPSRFFTILLCANFEQETVDSLSSLTNILIEKGNLYFCAWGPGCERAHDIYDETLVERELNGGKELLVMTTWHDDEPLEEALWFMLFCAMVEDEKWDNCSSIIITVGNNQWRQKVESYVSDISTFNDRMTKDS